MCLNTRTAKNINFSFETNGKLMALGVTILKLFRVFLKKTFPFRTYRRLDGNRTINYNNFDNRLHAENILRLKSTSRQARYNK